MAKKISRARTSAGTPRKPEQPNAASVREPYFVNGLAKGLLVIQAFGGDARALTLAEAATRTDMTRASARRILMTLEDLEFVARQGDRHFVLTPKVLSLGYAYLSSMPLWSFAEPVLERLVEELGETCTISAMDGTELVYVMRIPVHRILSQGVTIGSRLPMYCHSAGRVLLSDLNPAQLDAYLLRANLKRYTPHTIVEPARLRKVIAEVARKGYAWVSGEMEENISGLSVPIRSADGRVIAALNSSVNQPSVKEAAALKRFLPAIKSAAERLNASLAVGGPHAGVPRGRRKDGRG